MPLVASRKIRSSYPGQGYREDMDADPDTYYAGAYVSFGGAGGNIKVSSNADGDDFCGVVLEETVVSTADPKKVPVLIRSRIWAPTTNALAVKASVSKFFTATDDENIAVRGGTKNIIGKCVGYNADRNEIELDMAWTIN